jgi:predicted dehydrogenase
MTITRPGAPDRPSGTGLRVGLVGAGFIGGTHLAAWRSEGIDVVVFDVDPARSSLLADAFGVSVAPTLEALLVATDVVDICTPTHLHASVAIAATRAGRHVICEKPLARTLADGEAMLAAARQAGVRLLVGQVVRFYPEFAAARQAVVAGAIGDPAVLRLTRANSRPQQAADHWFFNHARSGGIILDLMIHDLDFARWVAGEVVSVACRSAAFEHPGAGVDHAVAILTHASGAISHVSASWAYAPQTSRTAFEIAGSRGLIEQDSDRTAGVERSLQDVGASGRATSLADGALGGDPFRLELAEFARAIEANVEPRTDGADALETLRLALAADQSARSAGQTIRLEAGAGS